MVSECVWNPLEELFLAPWAPFFGSLMTFGQSSPGPQSTTMGSGKPFTMWRGITMII